ncbi:MAG TPA: hypothetical protein VFM18_13145, partial [Methanosarcina sp.]|nr:hypothetical protein [Methanosarcina sp.]
MIKLDTTTRSLQIVLSTAKTTTDMPVVVSYSERTATATTTTEGTQLASSNGTTAVTICSSPASSTIVRSIEHISVKNADTASKTVTINLLDTATNYSLITVTMSVGDELTYTANAGWQVIDANGNIKTALSTAPTPSTGDNSTAIATTAFVQNSTLSTKLPTIGCSQASGALTFSASTI